MVDSRNRFCHVSQQAVKTFLDSLLSILRAHLSTGKEKKHTCPILLAYNYPTDKEWVVSSRNINQPTKFCSLLCLHMFCLSLIRFIRFPRCLRTHHPAETDIHPHPSHNVLFFLGYHARSLTVVPIPKKQRSLYYQPKQCMVIFGKPLKLTIDFYCLITPKLVI